MSLSGILLWLLAVGASIGVVIGAPMLFLLGRGRKWLDVGRTVAKPRGLTYKRGVWRGPVDEHGVHIAWAAPKRASGVRVEVTLRDHEALQVEHATVDAPRPSTPLGDPTFDAALMLLGPEALIRSRFTRRTRQRLLSALRQGVAFDGARLTWSSVGKPQPAQVEAAVKMLLDLADRLTQPLDVRALAETALTDEYAVAMGALRCLPPGELRDTVDAELMATVQDPRAVVAAERANDGQLIERLTRWATGDHPEAFRALALQTLAVHTNATAVARHCLDAPAPARIALSLLTHATPPLTFDHLAQLIADDIAVDAALPLTRRFGQAAEPLHLPALTHPDQAARLAATQGLAILGTGAALQPLQSLLKDKATDATLRGAAQLALSAIAERQSATAGRLTVLDQSEGGELSEA